MASSKTFLSPLWLRAEHSRNFLHRIFLCCRDFTRLLAWTQKDTTYDHSQVKGAEVIFLNVPTSALETISWFFSLSFSISLGSSLRSALVPTSSIGVSGQWCVTWSYESCLTRTQLHEVLLTALLIRLLSPLESTWIQHCQNWWDWSGRNTPEICPETS